MHHYTDGKFLVQNFGQNICCWKILDGRNFVDVFGGIFGGNFSGNAIFDILDPHAFKKHSIHTLGV